MTVDYDLVVIGGSAIARQAALRACSYQARVALVEPADATPDAPLLHAALRDLARSRHLALQSTGRWSLSDRPPLPVDWPLVQAWVTGAVADAQSELSPDALQTQIDVIVGRGRFQGGNEPELHVGDRVLRSRRYLLAMGMQWVIPAVKGIDSIQPLTPDSLWPGGLEQRPEHLLIVGDSSTAIELAQTLRRLAIRVTLAIPGDRFLPGEDRDAAALILALLEAEGVTVLTQAPLIHIRKLDGQCWFQVGRTAIQADQVVLAQARQPAIEALQLDTLNLRILPHRIPVNRRLQTHHPQIYACGDVLGGEPALHIAHHEMAIAVKNALFFPLWSVNYQTMPSVLFTDPPLARVGWTEQQARQRYGNACIVLKSPLKSVSKAHLDGQTPGFCKLILTQYGRLLGGQMIGAQAEEGISALALAMQNQATVHDLMRWSAASPSYSELIRHTAEQWRQRRSPFITDLIEEWFNLRRG